MRAGPKGLVATLGLPLVVVLAACSRNPPPSVERPPPARPAGDASDRSATAESRAEAATEDSSTSKLLGSAVIALEMHNYPRARQQLEATRDRCPESPLGRQAALLMAAAELDPQNPDGDPQRAADLMASYLVHGGGAAWTGPLAEAMYLQSLQLGAEPPPDDRTGSSGSPAGTSAGWTHAAGPASGCGAGLSASDSLLSPRSLPGLPGAPLAQRLEQLQQTVSELKAELERIRQTLEP